MAAELHSAPTLVTSRTPVGPTVSGSAQSMGGMAVNDAIIIIVVAWAVLFLLVFSLRRHNI
jgi:uncharacterized protein HemY